MVNNEANTQHVYPPSSSNQGLGAVYHHSFKSMKQILLPIILPAFVFAAQCCFIDKEPGFKDMPKIDAHVHIRTSKPEIMNFAQEENFRFITICNRSDNREFIDKQLVLAKLQQQQFPQTLAYLTAFSIEKFGEPGWEDDVLKLLQRDFEEGAIGVKVWKDIGMVFRDGSGNFIMPDDPRFDPVYQFIADKNGILMTHTGEPLNCWLPLDSMTVLSDQDYYKNNPQYHMFLHPGYPSHEQLIAARDHVLEKHPDLRMVGAHLGSLEWSVDELAKRLDRYPNFAVDMAARICHLQIQDRKKVKDFIVKYQDRLMYATDFGIRDDSNYEARVTDLKQRWHSDWDYFTTRKEMTSPSVRNSFSGLGLDNKILEKIFYKNALRWLPGVFQSTKETNNE